MGNYSRDTFDELKHYVSVRLQQGVPIVDADWNEMDDIRRHELKNFIKSSFSNGVSDNENFKIVAKNDNFEINAGVCLVDGWIINNPSTILYTDQDFYKNENELTDVWKVDTLIHLEQLVNGTEYIVFLDVWEREVTAQEDPNLVDSRIGIETCMRIKLEWVVRIQAGTSVPTPSENHSHYGLAKTIFKNKKISILKDLRFTYIPLTTATGVVNFPQIEPDQSSVAHIDPGLGSGPMMINFGIESSANKKILFGDADLFPEETILQPKLGVLVDQTTGTFELKIQAGGRGNPKTRVRWWASYSRIDKGELTISGPLCVAPGSPNVMCAGTGPVCTSQGQPGMPCTNPGRPAVLCTSQGQPAVVPCTNPGQPAVLCTSQGQPGAVPCSGQGRPAVLCRNQGQPGVPCVGTGPDCTSGTAPDHHCTGMGADCTAAGLPSRPCTGTGPNCTGLALPGVPEHCTGTGPDCTSGTAPDHHCTGTGSDCTGANLPGRCMGTRPEQLCVTPGSPNVPPCSGRPGEIP